MGLRIAINGYGRIGRSLLRALHEHHADSGLEIVAINELADNKTIAHLTKHDSTHGRFAADVQLKDQCLWVDGRPIELVHEPSQNNLPWARLNVDTVIECSGSFTDRSQAQQHIDSGCRRVLFSQPATHEVDATIVYGINHNTLSASDTIVSNASCTTNSIIPVIDIIDRAIGIENGVITTVHSAMNDQPVIDAYHHTDLRKTRSAMHSIIPVDTELARGIERIFPSMQGRFEAQAIRVPTMNVSAIDVSLWLKNASSAEAINECIQTQVDAGLHNILGITHEPLASCDFNHDTRSGIVDASQTRVAGGRLAKIFIWFDNEWAYANRLLDVTRYWASLHSPTLMT